VDIACSPHRRACSGSDRCQQSANFEREILDKFAAVIRDTIGDVQDSTEIDG
jgi:hypothetical protein